MESTGGQRVSLVANEKQYTFAVKKNDGDGNCLFHALEQTKLFEEHNLGHADIRSRIVDYVMEHWDDVGVSMVEQHRENIRTFRSSRVSLEQKRVAYWKYMSQWGAYATYGELEIASVIWNFGFSVLMYKDLGFLRRIISNEKGQYDVMNSEVPDMSKNGSGNAQPWFYFRFTGNPNSGHWENMCPIFLPRGVQKLPNGRFDFNHYDEQNKMKVYTQKTDQVELPKTEPEVKLPKTELEMRLPELEVKPSFVPPVFAKCPPQPRSGKAKDKKRPRSESPKLAKEKCKPKPKKIKLTMPTDRDRNGRKRKRSCSPGNRVKRPRSKEENDTREARESPEKLKSEPCKNQNECTRNERPNEMAKRSRSLSSEKSKNEARRCGGPNEKVKRSRSCSPEKSRSEVCKGSRHGQPKVKRARFGKSGCEGDSKECKPPKLASVSPFCGKRVLIAGVGGSGRLLIQRFYEAGAHVFVIDNEEDVLEEIRECFKDVGTFHLKTFRWTESQKILASLAPLDHLVNNAGILHPKRVLDLCPEDFKCSFEVNFNWLLGISIEFCKARLNEKCVSSTASIVNISSVFDRLALPGGAMYCCSQAALSTLTRSLAVEFGCHNIRVNTVKTFPLANEIANPDSEYNDSKNCKEVEEYLKDMEARGLIKESLNYEQIADSVLFLLGPESSGVTGTEVSVHAGITEF